MPVFVGFGFSVVLIGVGWLFGVGGVWRRVRAGKRLGRGAVWFRFTPSGRRGGVVEDMIPGVAAALAQLGQKSRRWSRGGTELLVGVRWGAGGVVEVLVGVCGLGRGSERSPERFVAPLASAVGCKAEMLDGPPVFDAPALVALRWVRTQPLAAPVQPDPAGLAVWLAAQGRDTQEPGWLLMRLEASEQWDRDRFTALIANDEKRSIGATLAMGGQVGSATTRVTARSMLRASIMVGAASVTEAQGVGVGAVEQLDGFAHTCRTITPGWVERLSVLCAVPSVLVWMGVSWFLGGLPGIIGAGVPLLLVGVVAVRGNGLGVVDRLERRSLEFGVVAVPSVWRVFNVRWMVEGWLRSSTRDADPTRDPGRNKTRGPRTAFPYPKRFVTVQPQQMVSLLAGPGELDTAATTGTASGMELDAPLAVRQVSDIPDVSVAVPLGVDPHGYVVGLEEATRSGGMFVAGDPGSGKSTLLVDVWWADLCAYRWGFGPSQAAPTPGSRCMIWWETKGEGAQRAFQGAVRAGIDPAQIVTVDVTGPGGVTLDLLHATGGPADAAVKFVDAMAYGFKAGYIEGRARTVLIAAIRWALSAPKSRLWAAEAVSGIEMTVPRIAFTLMGGDPGSGAAQALSVPAAQNPTGGNGMEGVADGEIDPAENDTQWVQAQAEWERYRLLKGPQAETLFTAPRDRLAELLTASGFWTRSRPKVGWEELLDGGKVVILNFAGPSLSESTTRVLASMALHRFRAAMTATCDGWQNQNRVWSIFADEVGDLTPDKDGSEEVIALLLDQGRSRGGRMNLATQRLAKLPRDTVSAVLSMTTRVYLRQENLEVGEAAAKDLSSADDTGRFTAADIRGLDAMTALVRMRAKGRPQPPFTMLVIPDTKVDPNLFVHSQVDPNAFTWNQPASAPRSVSDPVRMAGELR